MHVKLANGKEIPVEAHKVRIVQKATLIPAARRVAAMEEAGYNTFLLQKPDVFLDMLTDSGTNAMSDNQLAAMMVADDAYAGSESFYRLAAAVQDVLGFQYTMPVHQGRAAEHLLAKIFVKPGDVVLMNYHFTTTKAHIDLAGGKVLEIFTDEALKTTSDASLQGQPGPGQVRGRSSPSYGAENDPLRPHGSHHQPDRRTALLHGEPARRCRQIAAQPRHPAGLRRQPDLRERLLHQAARAGLSGLRRSRRSCAR